MKKTVQIVTISLDKSGKLAKKDTSGKYELAEGETVLVNGFGYTPQQLLVLSDDEIQGGDWVMAFNPRGELGGGYRYVTKIIDKNYFEDDGKISGLSSSTRCHIGFYKKVIASYPQLEGTLPISKETVQAWIDSDTPGEGSVEVYYGEVYSPILKMSVSNFKDEKSKTDPQGNLLLEFEPQVQYFNRVVFDKPSIPTDEEIKQKASDVAATKWELNAYIKGYKQALKDLGHG